MATFSDKTGRQWSLDLTIGAVDRVKRGTDGRINLLHPEGLVDGKQTQLLLMSDLLEFWEVLFLLVEPQCQRDNISADQFGELMAADCLVQAQTVFWHEWSDFFRKLQRLELATALEKMLSWTTMAKEKLKTALKRVPSHQLDREVMMKLDAALNAAFGSLPDSSESIREDIPGDISPTWDADAPAMIG